MRPNVYRLKNLLLSLFGSFLLTAPSYSVETLKIAIAGPHTGAYAAFGEQFWKGAEQAVKHINDQGGVLGKKLEAVKADDACEPKQARNLANRIIDKDGVAAVVGHFCSSSTITASEIYFENNILMMTPASTNPQVTERGLKTIFRMCGRDDQQGIIAANFIVDKLKGKRVAIIHDKTTYGRGLADATKDQLNKRKTKEAIVSSVQHHKISNTL